jgi:hypothetical protein
MGAERGQDWGESAHMPPDAVVVRDDGEARAVVSTARREGVDPPPIGLLGGDLCRTLGGRGDEERLRSREVTRVRVDLGSALLDGRQDWFLAHLVVRRSWLRGRLFAAMNAEWFGSWDLAPRAHPGDGQLDLLDADPRLADRIRARRRLRSGTHVPHPAIRIRRVSAAQTSFPRPTPIWLDHQSMAKVSQLSVRIEPGAVEVYV